MDPIEPTQSHALGNRISSLVYSFNHARVWEQDIDVWGATMRAPSFDRCLYLWLHRLGFMAKAERDLFKVLVKPGMRILDIGANIGLYTLWFARLTGTEGSVSAFEPEPGLFRALHHNCATNKISNVTFFNYAAGNQNGLIPFHRSSFNSGDNRLGGMAWPGPVVEVSLARLDDILPMHTFDFVKMDVQGHELAVLQGMEKIVQSSPNLCVFFEFWPAGLEKAATHPEALLQYFLAKDFFLYHFVKNRAHKIESIQEVIRNHASGAYTNLLASRSGDFATGIGA